MIKKIQPMIANSISALDIIRIGLKHGLETIGFGQSLDLPEAGARLQLWQDNGYNADMGYMSKNPKILSSIKSIFPDVRGYFFLQIFYQRTNAGVCPPGYGRVARYAWGKDYHKVFKKRLKFFIEDLRQYSDKDFDFRSFSDAVPLMERAFANDAGLGFIGKNTMLIRSGSGSFSLLAGVAINKSIIEVPLIKIEKGKCGSCQRCINKCPTGALVEAYQLDARRCTSYLTIEKRGQLSTDEANWLGEWIFGCDICQEVCPFNDAALNKNQKSSIDELSEDFGCGPFLKLSDILSIRTEEGFLSRFQGTPLMRTKREGLLRNCAIVAANTYSNDCLNSMLDCVYHDSSAVVRYHSLLSILKISKNQNTSSGQSIVSAVNNYRKDERNLPIEDLLE